MRQLKITKQVTNRETASLDKYLQEIGKVDLITAEEEVELAQKIRAGDTNALDKLTKANLRFVVSVAKQYQNQGLTEMACTIPRPLRKATPARQDPTNIPPRACKLDGSRTAIGSHLDTSASPSSASPSQSG